MDKDNIMHQDTVALDPETEELVILDQTRLPGQTVFLRLSTAEAIYQAIYTPVSYTHLDVYKRQHP